MTNLIFTLIPGMLFGGRMMNASINVKHEDYSKPKVDELDKERDVKCYSCRIANCSGITSIALMNLNFDKPMSSAEIEAAANCHPRPVSTK